MSDLLDAHPGILPFEGVLPTLHAGVWLAPGAHVIGHATLADDVNVWHNAVIRADVMPITIGPRTNVQDLSMIHVTSHRFATTIGADVTIGHRAILHGCTVGDRCLIGMGAIVLDGATIEDDCLIGAGALIPPGAHIPAGSVVLGAPGKIRRTTTDAERLGFVESARHYVELARRHG